MVCAGTVSAGGHGAQAVSLMAAGGQATTSGAMHAPHGSGLAPSQPILGVGGIGTSVPAAAAAALSPGQGGGAIMGMRNAAPSMPQFGMAHNPTVQVGQCSEKRE